MIYLNSNDIKKIGVRWDDIFGVIQRAINAYGRGEFSQPIKPYLRYGNQSNRIIAMPAYLGGDFSVAGIKWIASFPENKTRGIPRAHSVTILNEAETGVPRVIFNTADVSSIRTAGVSGVVLERFVKARAPRALSVGIIGLGPIGRTHCEMVQHCLRDVDHRIYVYDRKESALNSFVQSRASRCEACSGWKDLLEKSDVVITCTTSMEGYIDAQPRSGSLHLNVSLRDYRPTFREHVDLMIVDSWDEVCREGTDVYRMHSEAGLSKEQTCSVFEALLPGGPIDRIQESDVVMFNPMGMAVFDMAVASYFAEQARALGVGVNLE